MARSVPDSSDMVDGIKEGLKSAASDFGEAVIDRIDRNRRGAASGLNSAARSINDHADDLPGGERVAGLAHGAARRLNSTAKYIRKNDVNKMFGHARSLVKNNPVPVMIGAAALGFLLAKAFSSRD